MSYGPNLQELYRRAADLVDKILRGTKPADIPVEQPTKFDLVVNLTTAKAVGPRNFTNATRPRGQGDRIAFLLHCMSPVVARSGHERMRRHVRSRPKQTLARWTAIRVLDPRRPTVSAIELTAHRQIPPYAIV